MTRILMIVCLVSMVSCGADPNLGEEEEAAVGDIYGGGTPPTHTVTCGSHNGVTTYAWCLVTTGAISSNPNDLVQWSCTGWSGGAVRQVTAGAHPTYQGISVLDASGVPTPGSEGYNVHSDLTPDKSCDTCKVYHCN